MRLIQKNLSFITLIFATLGQNLLADITPLNLLEEKKLTLEQQLGGKIFFDTNLSSPPGQSCASCHDLKTSLTDSIQNSPVSLGAVLGRTGTRNTPSAAYSAFSPEFHFDQEEGLFIGGQFLDGRAKNLKEQAKGPFLNPNEMNNTDEKSVIEKIKGANYVQLFKQVYGQQILSNPEEAYDKMAQAIVAFENTSSFNQFTSKYDYFLAGRINLSEQEKKGLELFEDENKGNCAACHISKTEDGSLPLFTDFTYDNLGVPSNPDILALKGDGFIDVGLGETVGSEENGKFKVPSLRNITKTAPYMHNGSFSELKEVVDFYNTRDIDDKWGSPEVSKNVNAEELGDLKLTNKEVTAIVAFLHTLTDGYQLKMNPIFSVESGTLELPYVRTESVNQPDKFYSAQLHLNDKGFFELTHLHETPITDFSMLSSIPYYSVDTGILELPTIEDSTQMGAYIGQLKYLPENNGKINFELSYSKNIK